MKVVVSSEGPGLDAATSPMFGRCPTYVFVDTRTMEATSVSNPAQNAPGGAGIQAAQFVLSRGAQAVLTGNLGPNASAVFSEAAIPVYLLGQSTVAEALRAFVAGKLAQFSDSPAHSHLEAGATAGRSAQPFQEELAALAAEAADLRKRLAVILTRISELERKD